MKYFLDFRKTQVLRRFAAKVQTDLFPAIARLELFEGTAADLELLRPLATKAGVELPGRARLER